MKRKAYEEEMGKLQIELCHLQRWVTDTKHAPWYIVRSDDKKAARLNTIAHILSVIPYKKRKPEPVTLPACPTKDAYNDTTSIEKRRFVRELF